MSWALKNEQLEIGRKGVLSRGTVWTSAQGQAGRECVEGIVASPVWLGSRVWESSRLGCKEGLGPAGWASVDRQKASEWSTVGSELESRGVDMTESGRGRLAAKARQGGLYHNGPELQSQVDRYQSLHSTGQ